MQVLVKASYVAVALALLAACAQQAPASSAANLAAPHKITFGSGGAPAPSEDAAPARESTAPRAAEHGAAVAEHGSTSEHAEPAASSAPYLVPESSDRALQSPINIVTSRAVPGRHQIAFHYQTSKEHLDNLGHTVKVTYDAGSSLEYDGVTFDLVQFHFHTPSEHLLDGVTYPMEMHLVHAQHDRPERLLVIGVLFKEGDPNRLIERLLRDVPQSAGGHRDSEAKLDASSVFRPGEGYFH